MLSIHDEAAHALLPRTPSTSARSQFGSEVDLDRAHADTLDAPLIVNGRPSHSDNPNRYKQHGFHFNADNCIACHACESACSEKNNLPPHLAFRKVGYLEGGSYPDFLRINISMACNHCEDPVCLKGCPTRAYTKYAEYGAVLQDPNICFGCGYCTWVCPYNAPQLDPVKGQVEKCNMCVDRLEVGLKPACVAACLGNALEFGVIEDLPAGRAQAKTQIPGFPDPTISRPNIRFQQIRSLPPDFTRTDGVALHYQRDTTGSAQFAATPAAANAPRGWGLAFLSSRENPLVVFTLLAQLCVGAFVALFLAPKFGAVGATLGAGTHPELRVASLFGIEALLGVALLLTTFHIGKPLRFYRGFNNLRHSWLSREGAALIVFFFASGLYAVADSWPVLRGLLPPALVAGVPREFARAREVLGWLALVTGPLALYCMAMIYRIKARPFWNHWHTQAAFGASSLMLASALLGLVFGFAQWRVGGDALGLMRMFAGAWLAGLGLQALALFAHQRDLRLRGAEAALSRGQMLTRFGHTYIARWVALAVLAFGLVGFVTRKDIDAVALGVWAALTALLVLHELVGRALFYVLVTPTTMPGAFFWNNKYFERHARASGLAQMPQVGVVPDAH